MRISLLLLIFITLLSASHKISALDEKSLILFSTEEVAQQHCPDDEVVWLNTSSGIWHTKDQRWYGTTKHGAYVCKEEAAAAGNRASLSN